MKTLGLLVVFAALFLFDYKKGWKKSGSMERIVYSAIFCLAFILSELHVLGFKLIGLNQILDKLMKLIGLSA